MPDNWLREILDEAAAEVATWPEGMRRGLYVATITPRQRRAAVAELKARIKELEGQ